MNPVFLSIAARLVPLAAASVLLPQAALAQCATISIGAVCAPIVSNVQGSATAIDVHWLPAGGIPPQRVSLMQGGTAAKGFVDGSSLASAAQTSSLGQYASYDLHVGVAPNTSYQGTLHVLGFWGNQSLASAAFGASTASGPTMGGAPSITASGYANGLFSLSWTASQSYAYFNVRWSSGSTVAPNANQQEVGSGSAGSFSNRPTGTGPYTFIVEGCDRTFAGLSQSQCTGWSRPVTLYATPQPPPQSTTLTWPHMTAGDCEMQGASVTFRSNGTGTFASQVRTDHTHSGDVWHATISGRNAGGQTVVGLPTFDSMRMDDDHPYYQWTVNFEFDPSRFGQIASADMHKAC